MHTKTWIIDSSIVLTGSVNLTHNGLENNKEHLWEITNAQAIQPLIEDFERCWIEAEVVEQKDIDLMKETWSRKEEKKSGRARSASASIARSSSAIQEASV
jgi:phosphatidylserine/phosphatidylglycerophosphate/cardiolipin synthase-like enzyme